MYFKDLIIIFLSVLTSISCNDPQKKEINNNPVVMGYYVAPRYDYRPQNLPLNELTHIIFSFTEVIDNEMKFKHDSSGIKLKMLVKQKEKYPELKVMIACGGWGGSGGFSEMARSDENRKKFVESAIKFIKDYKLDGMDVDWEYPGMRGNGNPYIPEDKANFTSLLKELREAMDATGKDLVLTFASAGWKRYYEHIELDKVFKYATYMNVMTYDLVGPQSPFTAHHTNLGWIKPEDVEGTPAWQILAERDRPFEPRSAEKIIAYCMAKGVDPSKIVIGAAFYGRAWKGVPPENNGLYQKNKGIWIGWDPYSDIREKYEGKNGFIRHWDPVAKAPCLYNPEDSIFITYDDTLSVKLKTRYAVDTGLAGIMFWQLGNDTNENNSLLDAIYETKKEQSVKK